MNVSMNNSTYDKMKYLTQIVLPAIATLYFALSEIWGLPYGPEIVGTITALDAFLGIMLGLSASSYQTSDDRFDGVISIEETEDTKSFMLEFDGDPSYLDEQDEVLFRVVK